MKRKLLSVLLLGLWGGVHAQNITPSQVGVCGQYLSNTNFSLDYSVGQICTYTLGSSQQYLTQGFLQPNYDVLNSLDDKLNEVAIHVFPNPSNDWVSVSMDTGVLKQVSVYDCTGHLILVSTENNISLKNLPTGIYQFKIETNNTSIIKQIVKN